MKQPSFIMPPQIRGGSFLFLLIFFISFASASHNDCSITDLRSCLTNILESLFSRLPSILFSYLLGILNGPIRILLSIIQSLLTDPVQIRLFAEPWAIIVYMLSFFYGLLFLFVGFKLILSGESPQKREEAKMSLRNTVIMIIMVQLSYFLYELVIEVFAAMTNVVFGMINQEFFLITADNISNVSLQFVLLIPYLSILITFIMLLSLRYILVASGVIFFSIGLFMYFIGFLREYGSFIINLLIVAIALPFFYSIIFLAASKVLNVGIFNHFKILVALGAFGLVTLITLLLALFVLIKSALKIKSPIVRVAGLIQGAI